MLSLMLVVGLTLGQTEPRPTTPALPADALPAETVKKIERLLRQLSADEFAQREAAEKELSQVGAEAIPLLRTKLAGGDEERNDRLKKVIRQLENEAAKRVLNPTRVSLAGDQTIAAALAAIQQQTGNKFEGAAGRMGKLKGEIQDLPFWEAVDRVLDDGKLKVNVYGGHPNSLTVVARPEGELNRSGRAAYSGLFRIEPTRLEAVRDVRNPSLRGLKLRLEVSWEPRLTLISFDQPLDKFVATDDQGRRLELSKDGDGGSFQVGAQHGISAVELDIPFELPDRGVKKIATLDGTASALVPGTMETFEFPITSPPPAKFMEQQQRKADATVIVENVRINRQLTEVRMRIRFEIPGNALDSHLAAWIYNNDAYLLNAAGEKVEVGSSSAIRQAPNEVGMAYQFDLEEKPGKYRFVYKTPASLLKVPLQYQLKDIELP